MRLIVSIVVAAICHIGFLMVQVSRVEEVPPQLGGSKQVCLTFSASDPVAETGDTSEDAKEEIEEAKTEQPEYPRIARRRGWQGRVIVAVKVLKTGAVGYVSLQKSSGHQILDESALKTVSRWLFQPGKKMDNLSTWRYWFPFVLLSGGSKVTTNGKYVYFSGSQKG